MKWDILKSILLLKILVKILQLFYIDKTHAMIEDKQCRETIKGLERKGKVDSLKGSLIAPNQKFITNLSVEEKTNFSVTITYQDMQNKVTTENYNLKSGFSSDLIYTEPESTKLSEDIQILRK